MKNIKQIRLIHQTLGHEKDKNLKELARVNNAISKKQANIDRILAYQREYNDEKNLQITRAVPTLHQNLTSFTARIDKIIQAERIELQKLSQTRDMIVERVERANQKIKLMEEFEARVKAEELLKRDKLEQISIDDLASNKFTRGEHE